MDQELAMQRSWLEDEDKCTFIVLHKTPGVAEGSGSISDELAAMVGDVNLFFNDSDAPHTAEVEIMIAVSECRRLGLGREALLLMLWYGATRLQVTKYTAKIGLANTGSRHLFATLGFEEVSRSEVFQEVTLEVLTRNLDLSPVDDVVEGVYGTLTTQTATDTTEVSAE